MKWWHKWRFQVWLIRYWTAIGRIDDLKDSPTSLAMRSAVFDRFAAESYLAHHLREQGKTDIPCVESPTEQLARIANPPDYKIYPPSTKATKP